MIDHPLGPMGWGDKTLTLQENADVEKLCYDLAVQHSPICYRERPVAEPAPEMVKAWNDFVVAEGYEPGSQPFHLLSKFAFKQLWWFLPQDTGSCVFSNTFREVIDKMILEIIFGDHPEEYFGTTEFGLTSIAPHMISYGLARERANMKGSDGLYCQPMIESMMQDGFLTCNSPKLKEVMDRVGATRPEDYPEPRSTSLIRRLQNWEFNKELRPYCDHRLLESTPIRSGDDFLKMVDSRKTGMICSDIAVKTKGTVDSFQIHTRNFSDTWYHNMGCSGKRLDKRGNVYGGISNRSWIQKGSTTPEKYVYWVPMEELDSWFKRDAVTAMTIGDIDLPKSAPQVM